MELGAPAREKIRGHKIDYYLSKLEEVREATKKEFAKRDDNWIMKSEPFFGENLPTTTANGFTSANMSPTITDRSNS